MTSLPCLFCGKEISEIDNDLCEGCFAELRQIMEGLAAKATILSGWYLIRLDNGQMIKIVEVMGDPRSN